MTTLIYALSSIAYAVNPETPDPMAARDPARSGPRPHRPGRAECLPFGKDCHHDTQCCSMNCFAGRCNGHY
ncbi:hypothetical protein LX36DRAFT_664569 [Colletotrichum falcatum]|nr:hypothetical protein LX36DRAFT_664569 [Colletotrichum falcatum]